MSWWRKLWRRPMSPAKIDKVARLAANPFAQPDVRSRQMQRLLDDGSDAALAGVLRRFAANAQGQIADEEEKTWLQDALVQRGREAVGPLSRYIRRADKLSHALGAYQRIVGDEEAAAFYADVLRGYGPEDHRAAEAKLQLVAALVDCAEQGACVQLLAPFLLDHSDDVRHAVLQALAALLAAAPPAGQLLAVTAPLRQLVCDDGASPRIARQAAELLAGRPWALPPGAGALASCLAADYLLGDDGRLRARAGG